MKHVRRLTAMTLVLAFIFLLSTSAFAVERVDGNLHTHGNVKLNTYLIGGDRSVTAYMDFVVPTGAGYDFSATMVLTYTYCPEDAMRPLYYVTDTVSRSYDREDYGDMIHLETDPIPTGYVMVEATCTFDATITTPSGTFHCTPYDLTIYLT